jgi:hypothetical protein
MKLPWGRVRNNEQAMGAASSNQNNAIKRATTTTKKSLGVRAVAILVGPMRSIIATVSLCGPVFRPVDVLAVMYSPPASCAARLFSLLSCLPHIAYPSSVQSEAGWGSFFPREYSDRDMADQSVPPNTEVKNKWSLPPFPAMYCVHKKNFVQRGWVICAVVQLAIRAFSYSKCIFNFPICTCTFEYLYC